MPYKKGVLVAAPPYLLQLHDDNQDYHVDKIDTLMGGFTKENLEHKQPNQIGKAKSYCAVGIDWAPDGKHLMTSVLYERVKVDNMINIFTGAGARLLGKGEVFEQLQSVQC
jgi:hypothetical protein